MPSKSKSSAKGNDKAPAEHVDAPAARGVFPTVGVGASAGGIEAISELLEALGDSPGVAVAIVLHQQPKRESMLTHVLSRATAMPIEEIKDGTPLRSNHVYVAPPDAELFVEDSVLRLRKRKAGVSLPIDFFLRSLAQDQGNRAIAVVLSGSASDGALGAQAVKAEGGITFAQDDRARFTSMPHSAVSAGAVDFVLPPAKIAEELRRIARDGYVIGDEPDRLPERDMSKLFVLLRTAHDVDFTHYKPNTIERRIRRRMALHRIEKLDEYLEFLRAHPNEVQELYKDVLIKVTSFFRDAEVFAALERDIVPAMVRNCVKEEGVRIWVPGCATGEEVYSLAILFHEVASALSLECPLQLFGTDVSEQAVARAGAGVYPETIANEVSPERLRRFFTKVEGGYRVAKVLRDACIFARQDMTKDPPFSRLDLISCRNVMIYLGTVLQRKVMAMFHYALRPNGVLLLGSSESIGELGGMFSTVNRKYRIYRKRATMQRVPVEFAAARPHDRSEPNNISGAMPVNIFNEADRVLLARYAPAGVVINDNMDILQFRGRTSSFLEPAPGTASFNLLKMAKAGLLADLRAALQVVRKNEKPVRREGVRIGSDGEEVTVAIEVIPFTSRSNEKFHIVNFEAMDGKGKRSPRNTTKRSTEQEKGELARLKRELEATREYLQSIIEEQEAMNEELRSANEEVHSSNEELQSTNEEMETAKEELQSGNEELITLNEELEARNLDLARLNDDLNNILVSVEIPIIMVDGKLRLRRFNPAAERSLQLQPSDVGRSVHDLPTSLPLDNLKAILLEVIATLEVREFEQKSRAGHTFSVRIRPYRTADNKIEGAVIVALDLDEFRAIVNARA